MPVFLLNLVLLFLISSKCLVLLALRVRARGVRAFAAFERVGACGVRAFAAFEPGNSHRRRCSIV